MDRTPRIIWTISFVLFATVALTINHFVRRATCNALCAAGSAHADARHAPEAMESTDSRGVPGTFLPVPDPGPHDWLAQHDEAGQTLEQFLTAQRNVPNASRSTVYLLPLEAFDCPSPKWLTTFVETYFGMPTVLLPTLADSLRTFHTRRHPLDGHLQLHAGDILEQLIDRVPRRAYCLLAMTTLDLYPDESWNFVFGYASYVDRVGVFSFARYRPRFHDAQVDAATASLILLRSAKIVAHEIGHMFGMAHCTAYLCTMNGCNHLAEADRQPLHLCPVCRAKLAHVVKLDPAERYRRLGAIYGAAGWKEDSVWVAAARDSVARQAR